MAAKKRSSTRRSPTRTGAKQPSRSSADTSPHATRTSARSTQSGPARKSVSTTSTDVAAAKMAATDAVAAAFSFNAAKPSEFGDAQRPATGQVVEPSDSMVTGSTLTEANASAKVGKSEPQIGANPTNAPLDRVRVDSGGRALTTNQGVPVADNQNSLKAGLRGPDAARGFHSSRKDHALRSRAHPGTNRPCARLGRARLFRVLRAARTDLTRASIFAEAGKRTPVFVRFSTVAGERGSTDTARDVRGFAVKFYTDEGNWDLVGNNIPVFFIQDAMKFPDLIHAVKPEPHHGMPQAASAHDTFWDFVSLMPESTHMLMWVMSDRAIPRSYRMMQGFGVHTFRFVNEAGESRFVKFHWNPVAGTHSLVWDEAVKISGADPDFHRRDLWEAIEAGAYPEWELGVQVFTEEAGGAIHLRRAGCDEARSRRAGSGHADRPNGAQSQSRQFLRRNRAGRLLHGAHRAGHGFQQRSVAGGPHPLLRRHADLAARRSEFPRDSDQCAGGAGAQQPARRHASAGDSARSRRL